MESLVEITTGNFKALLAVCVVFTVGYAYNTKQDPLISRTLSRISSRILLPALAFTVLAGSQTLTWRHLVMIWPIAVVALTTHLASLLCGMIWLRFGTVPSWIAESLVMNNTSSFSILLSYALYMNSTDVTGLSHLKWRVSESIESIQQRILLYILVNLVVTEIARFVLLQLFPVILSSTTTEVAVSTDSEASTLVQPASTEPNAEEEPTERTPLVIPVKPAPQREHFTWKSFVTPMVIASVLGLLVGLIKPVQRFVVGSDESASSGWQSLGTGLVLLGLSFALIDVLGYGAGVRAGESKHEDEEVPPALGTVLIITFWRYICVPAFVIPVVYGLKMIPSTKAYIQDPSFSFVLALVNLNPPILPSSLTPFRSAVHFWLFYVSLILALPLAISIASVGRGISYDDNFDIIQALKKAAGGGIAGAAAMVLQVLTLMPLRTIMNYQYRYGGGFKSSIRNLWHDGGFKRYYAGLGAALFQGPLSRFGDTAANAGIIALLSSVSWPVLIKTIGGSLASATFRMSLTPIDTLKTTQQTRGGKAGLKLLKERIKDHGIGCLWWGALATAAATFVGNYPWFATYNWLSEALPLPETLIQKLARQAFIGFCASIVSDTISNSLRVVKTYRQVHERNVGYWTAAKEIVAAEGILALFGRGLPTRLLTNGLQGLLFSILWKLFTDAIDKRTGQ